MTNLTLDSEFETYLPQPSKTSDDELRRLVVKEGRARNPLVVWKDRNIVIGGQRRFKLCQELALPFDYTLMDFGDRDDVKEWMICDELSGRNLSQKDEATLHAKLFYHYRSTKRKKGGPLSRKAAVQKVMEVANVSERTVRRSIAYTDALESLPEDAKEGVKAVKHSQKDVVKLAKMAKEDINQVLNAIASQEADTIPDAIRMTLDAPIAEPTVIYPVAVPPAKKKGLNGTKPNGSNGRATPKKHRLSPGAQLVDPREFSKIENALGGLQRNVDHLHRTCPSDRHDDIIGMLQDSMRALGSWMVEYDI